MQKLVHIIDATATSVHLDDSRGVPSANNPTKTLPLQEGKLYIICALLTGGRRGTLEGMKLRYGPLINQSEELGRIPRYGSFDASWGEEESSLQG